MVSKKLLMSAFIAALGISSFAVAGGEFVPTPPPGCDVGCPNFYVGGRVGYGNNYWDNLDYGPITITYGADVIQATRRTKHTGFAGGVEIGYEFNKFVAIEAGFMGLPRSKVNHSVFVNGTPFFTGIFAPLGFPTVSLASLGFADRRVNNYAFDISGKISVMFPTSDCLGLFAKAGVGFLQSKHRNRDFNDGFFGTTTAFVTLPGFFNPYGFFDGTDFRHRNVSNTNLTYGFGIFYNLTPNMTLDGRFQRWHGNPTAHYGVALNRHGHQPYMDAYTVGLTYHIDGSGDLFNT